jgi:hypothetical protein
MKPIPINLVVEDELSVVVLRKILDHSARPFVVGAVYGNEGFGYVKSRLRAFNQAAKGMAYLLLVDLDRAECAPVLIREWFGAVRRHPNLLFRVAAREVEAWLLAHRSAFARFARIRELLVPGDVEKIPDPKRCVIDLVSRSRSRGLRNDVVPRPGSTSRQGPNYNAALARFVLTDWDPGEAMQRADSLRRLVNVLNVFSPVVASDS